MMALLKDRLYCVKYKKDNRDGGQHRSGNWTLPPKAVDHHQNMSRAATVVLQS